MRFRASIENVPTFFKIIQTIEKLQKKCIIKFTETNMQIICNDRANEGGVQVWSQIKVSSLFTSYRIQSNSDNEITLILSADALLVALKSALSSSTLSLGGNTSTTAAANTTGESTTGAGRFGGAGGGHDFDEIIMKLAKKNGQAMLNFEILGTTRMGKRVRVGHDVKVEVLKPVDVEKLKEPMCPEPDTHILLPSLPSMRTVVDRLRPMSDILAVSASNSGIVKVSIHTEAVKVDTEWKDCVNPKMASSSRPATQEPPDSDGNVEMKDPAELFTVLVSLKSFLKFLNSHVVSTTTIACICHHHCLILYVYIGDVADAGGVLTFYIPGVVDDD